MLKHRYIRSSNTLDVAQNQFQIQGLELDYTLYAGMLTSGELKPDGRLTTLAGLMAETEQKGSSSIPRKLIPYY